ncbi:MAG: hypothetical protein KAT86_02470 [Candidatus Latescibacteria bacterium]|nr:hypothetical protein [Candidatus Latescibacterota bacterium]
MPNKDFTKQTPSVAPSKVLSYGRLRYIAAYTNDPFPARNWSLAPEEENLLLRTHSTLFHASVKEGYACAGLPSREQFEQAKAELWDSGAIDRLRKHGVALIYYLAATRIRGDEAKRTEFYNFYDHRWEEYEDYFGPKPADPTAWARVISNGQPAIYTTESTPREHGICINKPRVRDYIKGAVHIAVDLGAQGIFFDDSPIFCYCEYCDAKFRKHLGRKFSPAQLKEIFGVDDLDEVVSARFVNQRLVQMENPLFVEWRRYRAQNYVEYLAEIRDYGRSLDSNFILTDNSCTWEGEPYRQYDFAMGPLEEWMKVLDLMFIEAMQYGNPKGNRSYKETNSSLLKYCQAACRGKPISHLTNMGTLKHIPAYEPLVELGIAECHAHGAAFICIPRWNGWKPEEVDVHTAPLMAGIEKYNRFLARNESLFIGAESYANVAVLCSLQQAYGKQMSYPMAISRMLSDEQIPHLILVDEDLETGEKLSRFDALLIPEAPMMSDRQIETVEWFAEKGGGVVIFGQTAWYDEYGRLRRERLGFHKLLQDMEPWGHIDVSIDPAVGINTTRKGRYGGGRVVYIPRDAYVGFPSTGREAVVLFKDMASITADRMSGINVVFEEIVEWAAGGRLSGYCSADSSVEYTLMHHPQNRQVLVHLVNYKVDVDGTVVEEKDIRLKAAMPDGKKPVSVQLISPDFEEQSILDFTETQEGNLWFVEFVIPRLVIYDVVAIEVE